MVTPSIDPRERLHADHPIVVGTDGSVEATRGVAFAADLARRLGSKLVIVHAIGMTSSTLGWEAGHDAMREEAERHLALGDPTTGQGHGDWLDATGGDGRLDLETRIVDGNASLGLLRVADEIDAGFVVVGSHGAGDASAPLLGSTSHHVVRHSRHPVIVVPPADNHRHQRVGSSASSADAASN